MRIRQKAAVAGIFTLLSAVIAAGTASAAPGARAGTPPGSAPPAAAAPAAPAAARSGGPADRALAPDRDLAKGWKTSQDRAVTLAPDADGLHVLAADSKDAYAWHTVTTLSESGFDTDLWIGNSCLADRAHAFVVYAPRAFTNTERLMERGAFTAVVDLDTGAVRKLPLNGTLASFDPACDTASHSAVFTQIADGSTRLVTVDTAGRTVATTTAAGEITSAVPSGAGVLAADGHRVVRIDRQGRKTTVATTSGVPYAIHQDSGGGTDFLDQTASRQSARRTAGGTTRVLATGEIGSLGLDQGLAGQVFLTGTPTTTSRLPSQVRRVAAPAGGDLSTEGRLSVAQAVSPGLHTHVEHPVAGTGTPPAGGTVQISARVTGTARTLDFAADPRAATAKAEGGGKAQSPSLTGGSGTGADAGKGAGTTAKAVPHAGSPTSTVDTDRTCAIARNDPALQAYQPTPNQVEWAVDMAVRGDLTSTYLQETDWRSREGLGSSNPQGMFPLPPLTGGGRIPAQVLLGILTQESNLWQAEGGALPGQSSSPITGNFYGHDSDATGQGVWKIDWSNTDCGYGIGQITDGMKLGSTSLTAAQQKAVALDYAANIAEAARILATKWNELQASSVNITINNNSASAIEDWFAAVWDYNSGFNPPGQDPSGFWGLGWLNNPANPLYPPDRHAFLDGNTYADAAHPERWPYEEKVMGWAAWPIDTGHSYTSDGHEQLPTDSGYGTAGYTAAWWAGDNADIANYNRSMVKPPLATFCQPGVNDCNVSSPPTCETDGLHDKTCDPKHWWSKPATWKTDCSTTCGHESLKYVTLRAEPGNADSATPDCNPSKIPAGSLLIDSVSGTVPPLRSGCTKTWTDAGTLSFSFDADSDSHYEAKADLHQIGGGFGDHFWYAHTRNSDTGVVKTNDPITDYALPPKAQGNMAVRGTWQLSQNISKWARVWVHIPATGATSQQAIYAIHTGSTSGPAKYRMVNMSERKDVWVQLGVFQFSGTGPQGVELTNWTYDGTADDDVAWDAAAIQPLPGKPANFVVSMGDSYSSGEGAADGDGDYYSETDWRTSTDANGCHRSFYSWARWATLPGTSSNVGYLADSADPGMDFHQVACSGAQTPSLSSLNASDSNDLAANDDFNGNFFGELPQIHQGYLDENTTLVTLTIGGNDARFGPVMARCMLATAATNCASNSFKPPNATANEQRTDRWLTGYGNAAGDPLDEAIPLIIDNVAVEGAADAIGAIRANAPHAKIVILGYPRLFENQGSCVRSGPGVLSPFGLSAGSVAFLNEMGDYMNTQLKAMVTQMVQNGDPKLVFADPTAAFAGRGVCGTDPAINSFRTTLRASDTAQLFGLIKMSAESFHPNKAGTQIYAQVLQAALTQ